jgi:hypothetical protein
MGEAENAQITKEQRELLEGVSANRADFCLSEASLAGGSTNSWFRQEGSLVNQSAMSKMVLSARRSRRTRNGE